MLSVSEMVVIIQAAPTDCMSPPRFDAWLAPVRDEAGLTWARLTTPDGRTTAMWADGTFEAWQVCTGDYVPAIARRGVAVEPMTCIADAFRTGDLLVELAPGQTHEARWGLRLE